MEPRDVTTIAAQSSGQAPRSARTTAAAERTPAPRDNAETGKGVGLRGLSITLPAATGPWTAATRRVLESHTVQDALITFLALCGSEGQVLWALLKGHAQAARGAGGGFSVLSWLWEFFSRSPEETLRILKTLKLPELERAALSKIVIGRGARVVGTGVGLAQAFLAWNELAHAMDNKEASRTERTLRLVIFVGSLLGCFPRLPQLRLLSSAIALAGAIVEAAIWSQRRGRVIKESSSRPQATIPSSARAPRADASWRKQGG